jgi:hypothetical protein
LPLGSGLDRPRMGGLSLRIMGFHVRRQVLVRGVCPPPHPTARIAAIHRSRVSNS